MTKDKRQPRVWPIVMVAPDGKRHRVHYSPNTDGFGAHAWVWCGFGKRINQYAAGDNVIDNLVRRLKAKGWKEGF